MTRLPFFAFVAVVVLLSDCTPLTKVQHSAFTYTSIHAPAHLKIHGRFKDKNNRTWGIGKSEWTGFNEFWITMQRSDSLWSPPIYTGIPALFGQYSWNIDNDTMTVKEIYQFKYDELYVYRRSNQLFNNKRFKLSINNLKQDSDRDGLVDNIENILLTNPHHSDTDGDGKADGFDQNPLAAPAKQLKIHERLHKYIIELELKNLLSDQLLLVEQINNKSMEYERQEGFVLSLGTKEIDNYLDKYGYGVPVLSTAIKDTLRKYKVSFEYFVSPEDAWGYENIYDWDRKSNKWIEGEILNNWEAEWSGLPPLLQINIRE